MITKQSNLNAKKNRLLPLLLLPFFFSFTACSADDKSVDVSSPSSSEGSTDQTSIKTLQEQEGGCRSNGNCTG
jgi:hypothetical protein